MHRSRTCKFGVHVHILGKVSFEKLPGHLSMIRETRMPPKRSRETQQRVDTCYSLRLNRSLPLLAQPILKATHHPSQ